MIQIQRLEGFYWVARTEGYARAARAFPYPITQPGVHQQVKRLETELGFKLFERVGKDRVVLTPEGRALYLYVAPFLEGLQNVVASLRKGELSGTLRIHASALVLRSVLPDWLRRIQAKRPQIEIALFEAKTPDLALLKSGETDLLVDHVPDLPDELEGRKVANVHAFLAVPSGHPAAAKKQLRLADVRTDAFIAYGQDKYLRELQMKALALHGVTPPRVHTADSFETILGFVAAGLGYSLVPALEGRPPKMPGVLAQRLERPQVEFPVLAVWRKGAAPNPLIEAAMELAPEAVNSR